MKKNILSVVLSIVLIFRFGAASGAEVVRSETHNIEMQRNAYLAEEAICPAVERFNIAESVSEIHVSEENEDVFYDTLEETPAAGYSESDLYWLSRIIEAEASGESQKGKIAVGNCVINRTKSTEFPNSIYDVIFDKKHGVQYQPTANGSIYNTPSEASVQAAKDALNGYSVVENALYFCSTRVAPHSWASKNRKYLTTIGNHVFYL